MNKKFIEKFLDKYLDRYLVSMYHLVHYVKQFYVVDHSKGNFK